MNVDLPIAQIKKTSKEIIISQIKTGDIVKVKSEFFPLIFHYGIICNDKEGLMVYHNDPDQLNFFGGNIIRDDFQTWIKNKEIVEVITTGKTVNDIETAVKELKTYKYDVFNFNCEHFISKIKDKKPISPQIINWAIAIGAVVATVMILRRNKR